MGIQDDTFIGLNIWAQVFVRGEQTLAYFELTRRVYPSGMEELLPKKEYYISNVVKEQNGKVWKGMSSNAHLMKYIFPDGLMFDEFVQAEKYENGFKVFTALHDFEGNTVAESVWKPSEMRSYL